MLNFFSHKLPRGQSLVELLLVIGLAAVMIPALLVGLVASREGKVQQRQRMEATDLLREAQEAVRSVRERGWVAFAVNGTYHPEISGSSWVLLSGAEVVNGFTRSIAISDVYRDTNDVIVTSGGALDPSSKKVTVSIGWSLPYASSIVDQMYVTRYLDNNAHTDTLEADFTAGTPTNTSVTNVDGGEVILGAGGGGGDWCQPSKSITAVDLPKSGVANAISAIEGTVFAGTGDNSSGISFAKVQLVGDSPPAATIPATFDGYKTNAVFGETNYAYLGTDNNAKEVVILNLTQYSNPPTNTKYLEVGSINAPGNGNGNSIYVASDKAYILDGTKLYIYTLSSDRTTSALQNASGLTISGTGKKVLVVGNYAYIATSATTNNLQIVDISNAASPSITGQKTLGSSQAGVDLFINTAGDRVYFVTAYAAGQKDFYIINTSTKSNPTIVGNGYDTGGMSPTGVTVVTGNRAIIVGTGGTNQYQVINISNEINPTSCASLQYATGVNGVGSILQSNGYAYSYIITGDASAELKVILGGAGGQYSSAGSFVSRYVDAGTNTIFNRFDATFVQPSQTTIGFQVAVAQAVNNSCVNANYTFIGPNHTSNPTDLFTGGSPVPILSSGNYQNPGRCFKYKLFVTSNDPTQTPELDDFTVNYSP